MTAGSAHGSVPHASARARRSGKRCQQGVVPVANALPCAFSALFLRPPFSAGCELCGQPAGSQQPEWVAASPLWALGRTSSSPSQQQRRPRPISDPRLPGAGIGRRPAWGRRLALWRWLRVSQAQQGAVQCARLRSSAALPPSGERLSAAGAAGARLRQQPCAGAMPASCLLHACLMLPESACPHPWMHTWQMVGSAGL